MVRRDDAGGHDLDRLGDHGCGRHGHQRVEVARRHLVFEIAAIVGALGGDEGEVGAQRLLDQEGLAVDHDGLLALLHRRADAGRGQDAAQPVAAGAHLLGQRPLRHQLDRKVAGDHLLLGLRVGADMRGDHLPERLGDDEKPDAVVGPRGVVADDGEVLAALADQFGDDAVRAADPHEAADHQHGSIGNHLGGLLDADRLLQATARRCGDNGHGNPPSVEHCVIRRTVHSRERAFKGWHSRRTPCRSCVRASRPPRICAAAGRVGICCRRSSYAAPP